MGEWRPIRLAALGDIVTGKTPSKDNPEDWGDEMPFVTPSDYSSYGKYATTSLRELSLSGIERLRKKVVPPGSILVTCIGSDMGKSVINRVPVITNQQINSISIANEEIDPDFIYYFMVGMEGELKNLGSSGSAVPLLNKGDFEQIEVICPELSEQRAIASVLSSLDAKIDLLHRQNKTLEAMAETLFRQWFVEEAEEGWAWVQLSEHIRVHRGLSYTGAGLCGPDEGVPMHNLNSVYEGGGYKYEGIKHYKGEYRDRHIIKPGELIITNTEQGHDQWLIGCPAIIPRSLGEEGIFSQHVYRIEMLNPLFTGVFVNHLVLTSAVREQLTGATNGSTVNMLPADGIEMAKFKLPPDDKIQRFNEFALPLQAKQETNHEQIKKLIALRDTLLPKLMSGEVRVKMS